MAKKSKIAKWKRQHRDAQSPGGAPGYKARSMNRCNRCARPRAYIRFAGLCRVCFRQMALNGHLPGVRKASW